MLREIPADDSWLLSLESTHFNKGSPGAMLPDDELPILSIYSPPASSFGFRGFYTAGVGSSGMRLYGGYVDNLLGTHVRVEDTVDTTLAPPVTGTEVPITGGILNPTRVCVQVDKTTGACSFVALADEPPSSGSYWYRVLHEAYLAAGTGKPVYKMDRRFDWMMGSPI